MKKTKIDWCDCTVNPVVGCKNGCKYCYADRMNDRFHFVEKFDCPQFFPERLKDFASKKPKTIFVDSMSDIGWWEDEWCEKVFKAMLDNPQHNYIFLTKGYGNLRNFMQFVEKVERKNIFIGKTVDTQSKFNGGNYNFLSIEPILEPINLKGIEENPFTKQVIIGAETGNRKGKVIPKKEWIDDIVNVCDNANIRVFMKESLRKIMGEDFRQDELIWEIKR